MPQVNLTFLSGQELRQRLDSSRARGDAVLAYEILQEMASRREAEAARRPRPKRRPDEPRFLLVDAADDVDPSRDDDVPPMPNWQAPDLTLRDAGPPTFRTLEAEPPAPPLSDAEPGTASVRDPPLVLADKGDDLDLRMPAEEALRPRAPVRSGVRVAAGFVIGITAGVALGWWGGEFSRAGITAPLQVASQDRAATPVPAVLEVSVAETAVAPLPPRPADPSPLAEAPPAVPPANAEPELAAASAPAPVLVVETPAPAPAARCESEPTPADRTICADPDLQRLQRDLRRAYAEALDAHEDRTLLRQRQLAWRQARNEVSEPDALARLYDQRIARLNGAAAQARAQR